MVPIRLLDSLTLEPTPAEAKRLGEISFRLFVCDRGPGTGAGFAGIPAGKDNLVVRALGLLRQRSGCQLGANVELFKRIPAAAGLGGGSSDAAAALELANLAWGIHWPNKRLARLAAELGSDVPFFLSHGPAICRGRGEIVERLPSVPPFHVVIVKPPAALATRDVYERLDVQPSSDSAQQANGRCRLGALTRGAAAGKSFRFGSMDLQPVAGRGRRPLAVDRANSGGVRRARLPRPPIDGQRHRVFWRLPSCPARPAISLDSQDAAAGTRLRHPQLLLDFAPTYVVRLRKENVRGNHRGSHQTHG